MWSELIVWFEWSWQFGDIEYFILSPNHIDLSGFFTLAAGRRCRGLKEKG